jgi:hypothetical protein
MHKGLSLMAKSGVTTNFNRNGAAIAGLRCGGMIAP